MPGSTMETSAAAYATVKPHLPSIRQQILKVLEMAGQEGCTIDELCDALPHLQKVSLSPSLRPMTRRGDIIETDRVRAGRSGCDQRVWVAA